MRAVDLDGVETCRMRTRRSGAERVDDVRDPALVERLRHEPAFVVRLGNGPDDGPGAVAARVVRRT
jgi:hypothetical protein